MPPLSGAAEETQPLPCRIQGGGGVAGGTLLPNPRRVPPEVPLRSQNCGINLWGGVLLRSHKEAARRGQESAGLLEGHRGRRGVLIRGCVRIGPPSLRPTHGRLPPLEMAKPTADEEAAFLLLLP